MNGRENENLKISQSLGDFEIISKLGQGGMGEVYKARQKSLDRIVALKVLPAGAADDEKFIERFQREARASAKLNHPNIVQGIAVGQDEASGRWYFAMELIDGPSLKQVLKRQGKLAEDQAQNIAREMANALDCALKNGFVHRDIKPDNILMTNDGQVKLADLGLARRVGEDGQDTTLTQSGQAVGTPAYMAPEQIRGEREKVDIRTDIYALGATLFHLVTGRTPYDGKSSALVMSNHLTQKVPLAHTIDANVSERFSKLIARMMQKEREQRVQNPAELMAELTKLNSVEAAAPRRAATPKPSGEAKKKHARASGGDDVARPLDSKQPLVLAGIAGGVVVLGLLGYLILGGKPSAPIAEANNPQPDTPANVAPSPVPAPTIAPPAVVTPAKPAENPAPLDVREDFAQRKLVEIKKHQSDAPQDAAGARKLFEDFIASYASTRAGKEAAGILKTLPPPPAPAVAEVPPAKVPEPAKAPETAVVPAPPVVIPEPAKLAPATEASIAAYQLVAADVYTALRAQQFAAATETLGKARANAALAPMQRAIDFDLQCVKLAEAACQGALDGAAKLSDKRAFSLLKSDGKEIKVGVGTKNSVGKVKDGVINIDQDLGGGLATTRVKLDQLSPRTVFDLASLGLSGTDADLKLAAWGVAALSAGSEGFLPKSVQDHLDAAARNDAAKPVVEHLRSKLEAAQHETEAEPALKRIDPMIKAKHWDAAETALNRYKQDFASTQAFKRLMPEYEKKREQVDAELHPLKPGLWSSFYTMDNKKLLTRVEVKLTQDFKDGSPDPVVPADWFQARYAGVLRVEREGKYTIALSADDYLGVYIDGKLMCEAGTHWIKSARGAVLELNKDFEMELSKGDHDLKVEYKEALGNANFSITWTPPGGTAMELPGGALFHDPRKVEDYQRAP